MVLQVAALGEVGVAGPVARHHPHIGADPTKSWSANRDRVTVPGMEQNPAAAWLGDRNLVPARQPTGEAGLLASVERGPVNVDGAITILVTREGVVPDDVVRIEPVGCLADEEGVFLDYELEWRGKGQAWRQHEERPESKESERVS